MTCLASNSVYLSISEYLILTPHFSYFLPIEVEAIQNLYYYYKLHLSIIQDFSLYFVFIVKFTCMNTSTLKTSRSVSRSKSQKKTNRNPASGQHSSLGPSPKRIKVTQEVFTAQMNKLREKMSNTLDAYILIFQSASPMRCLEHNSVISLYCQTQQKLLCANCVYKSTSHKLHKVYPIQKCYKHIARDVDQISRQIQREMQWADSSAKSIGQLFKQQEKDASDAMLSLTQMYDQVHFELQRCYEQSKKKIINSLDSIFAKQQALLLQLQFFKDILARNKLPSTDPLFNPDHNMSQNMLLFHHQVGNTLLQYGKLDGNKLIECTSRIKHTCRRQFQKITEVRQVLQKWRGFNENRSRQKQRQKQLKQQKQHKQILRQSTKR